MSARVDRTVIVTRALGAIGQVRAQGFSAEVGHVGLAARPRHEEAGRALADDIGNGALLVSSDVADEASWAEAVAMVEDLSGSMADEKEQLAIIAGRLAEARIFSEVGALPE